MSWRAIGEPKGWTKSYWRQPKQKIEEAFWKQGSGEPADPKEMAGNRCYPADSIGDELTYMVLLAETNQLVARSKVHPAKNSLYPRYIPLVFQLILFGCLETIRQLSTVRRFRILHWASTGTLCLIIVYVKQLPVEIYPLNNILYHRQCVTYGTVCGIIQSLFRELTADGTMVP